MNANGLRRVRGSTGVKSAARMGLVGRRVFYLILAALTLEVVMQPRGSVPQANANGALSEVAKSPAGLVLVAAAGVGFVAFGMVRLAGAITDDRHGRLRRVSTAGQGLMYLALAATTASFVLGRHGAGSEQQQRRTSSTVLGLPGGRALLAVALRPKRPLRPTDRKWTWLLQAARPQADPLLMELEAVRLSLDEVVEGARAINVQRREWSAFPWPGI